MSFISRLKQQKYKGLVSYSQSAEDLIINRYLEINNISEINYLDIGANDPIRYSNTYFFYKRGHRGVCIEPNPELVKKIKAQRPGDNVLNVGVGLTNQKEADFYVMNWDEFSTFSKERALSVQEHYKGRNDIKTTLKIPLIDINELIKTHFGDSGLKILNLDVEGIDFEIIKKLDFSMHRPKVICVEAIDVTQNDNKQVDFISFFKALDYKMFADTSVNYIFVDNQ